jgi:prophage maintenance system killer protein
VSFCFSWSSQSPFWRNFSQDPHLWPIWTHSAKYLYAIIRNHCFAWEIQ